jgi:hypothetical protein
MRAAHALRGDAKTGASLVQRCTDENVRSILLAVAYLNSLVSLNQDAVVQTQGLCSKLVYKQRHVYTSRAVRWYALEH